MAARGERRQRRQHPRYILALWAHSVTIRGRRWHSRPLAAVAAVSAARRSVSRRSSAEVDGRPGGRCGWVQCRAMRRRCQRNSVSGVTSHPARLGRASAAAIAASKLRSASVNSGRSIWRRSTASWWRNTMISRSLERPERTVSRASDARNRYKIRYARTQDRPASRHINDHGRVSGTHTPQRGVVIRYRQRKRFVGSRDAPRLILRKPLVPEPDVIGRSVRGQRPPHQLKLRADRVGVADGPARLHIRVGVRAVIPSRAPDQPRPGFRAPTCVLKGSDDDVEDRRHDPCCASDGGRSSGVAVQAEIPNHRRLRRSRAGVVSAAVDVSL